MLDDTVTPTATQSRNVTTREVGAVAAVLAAAVALAIFASDGGILLTRPLWVDEVHTVLVAERASPATVIGDLANGADFGPPLVPLAAWTLRHVAGALTPTLLRSASLLCVMGALLLTYVVLRRRFAPGASLAGILAVGSQELLIAHSYEGRFYGPWLLCTALFVWALTTPRKRVRLVVAAVMLCTVHWYGVITLALIVVGSVSVRGREWRATLQQIWPAAAGLVALALCLPLSFGQRNALSVATWVPGFTVTQLTVLLGLLWASAVPAFAMVAIAFGCAKRASGTARALWAEPIRAALGDVGVAALLSLALVPLALAALSLVGQPSMLPRYSIPSVLALAPLASLGAEAVGRWPQRVLMVWLMWLWLPGYAHEAQRKRAFDAGIRQAAASFRQAAAVGGPVVFSSMHILYAVSATLGEDRASLAFLEINDSTTSALLTKGGLVERDVVRVHARRFGFPRLIRQADLRNAPRFAVVGLEPNLAGGYASVLDYARAVFPDHCAVAADPGVTVFVLRQGLAKC